MKIKFLESSARDIDWMRRYYRSVFVEGSKNAQKQYLSAMKALSMNAFIGHPSERVDGAREYHIPRTPFTFVYRVKDETIEVLRLLDGRSSK